MSNRLRACTATALATFLLSTGAVAEPVKPPLHLETPSEVKTEGGTNLQLPPGYFMEEPTYNHLDAELRRLQEAETRLNAENKVLKQHVEDTPNWKWWTLIAVGTFAGGMYVGLNL